jgi:hypothetical protein
MLLRSAHPEGSGLSNGILLKGRKKGIGTIPSSGNEMQSSGKIMEGIIAFLLLQPI